MPQALGSCDPGHIQPKVLLVYYYQFFDPTTWGEIGHVFARGQAARPLVYLLDELQLHPYTLILILMGTIDQLLVMNAPLCTQ
jgi:hypothetical protein